MYFIWLFLCTNTLYKCKETTNKTQLVILFGCIFALMHGISAKNNNNVIKCISAKVQPNKAVSVQRNNQIKMDHCNETNKKKTNCDEAKKWIRKSTESQS